jgi:integrase
MTTELVERFRDELLFEDELSPKTVKDILVLLKTILKHTAKAFPSTFPRIEITYPRDVKKEMRVLSRDEQNLFVEYLLDNMDECKFGILLSLFTGIRIGELCALRWENISLQDNTIKIASTMQRLQDMNGNNKTKIIIGTPKSETSQRTIPLTQQAAILCRRMQPQSKAAYVLTGTLNYMEPRTLQYRLERYTKDCGL